MSCNCSSSVVLPTVEDDVSVSTGVTTSCTPCAEGVCSTDSEGSILASSWLDSCCSNEGVTLLGRKDGRLTRFTGTGFIKLVSGVASVVTSVPLKIVSLWNNRWKTSPTSRPIIGEPLAFPYLVIGASTGDVHGIKGNSTEDSSPVWDASANEFSLLPLSEQSLSQKGLLPRLSSLELVGYAPIVEGGDVDQVRVLSSITGTGIPISQAVATVDSECMCEGCTPEPSFASVVSLLAPPEDDGDYVIRVVVTAGVPVYSWIERV